MIKYQELLFLKKLRELKIGISNIIAWFSIIWTDRDWDHYFIARILIFKLKRIRRYIILHDDGKNNQSSIHSISECIELLEKINDSWNNYLKPAYEEHQKKWSLIDDKTQMSHDWFISSRIADHQRLRDLKIAMDIFYQNFDNWWH